MLQSTQYSMLRPEVAAQKGLLLSLPEDEGKGWPIPPRQENASNGYGYYKSIFRKDPLTSIVTPPIQEFSLKTNPPIHKRSKVVDGEIVKDIQKELDFIRARADQEFENHVDESWSSSSYDSSESSQNYLWEDEERKFSAEERKRRSKVDKEQTYGQVFVSFVPIMW